MKKEEKKANEDLVSVENTEDKEKFLNTFDFGVTYAEFQKALGEKTVAEYCNGKLTKDQIDWLENELSIINKK